MSGESPVESRSGAETAARMRDPFLPLVLLAVAFLAWMTLETVQLVSDRRALRATAAQQVAALQNAYRTRVAADSLASKTQALADKGNADARAIVASLRQRGITINPSAKTAAPP